MSIVDCRMMNGGQKSVVSFTDNQLGMFDEEEREETGESEEEEPP